MASAAALKDPSPTVETSAYERDFYSWTLGQAAELRSRRPAWLDWENLAEEVEDLGKEVFSKLSGSFRVILIHMLKWDHQPDRRSRSWAGSIETHRIRIEDVLSDNPALRRRQDEAISRAYREARVRAAVEMKRDKRMLPETCPYDLAAILERKFEWPDQ